MVDNESTNSYIMALLKFLNNYECKLFMGHRN